MPSPSMGRDIRVQFQGGGPHSVSSSMAFVPRMMLSFRGVGLGTRDRR
jgi:hypothetical protein